MALTEEQLKEAETELARRKKVENEAFNRRWAEAQRAADERFLTKMDESYPAVSQDDRYDIYSAYRDYYEDGIIPA